MTRFDRFVTIATAATLLGGLLSFGAHAQNVTTEQYRNPKNEKDLNFNKAYLTGIKDGLIAYNMSSEDKLFCMPGPIPILTFEQANNALLHWARKKSADAESLPLGLALLYGLKEAFPCPK
jgi:hypothetical protein